MRTTRITSAVIGTLLVTAAFVATAPADEFGPAFHLDFGRHPVLQPTLRATEVVAFPDEGHVYDYTARGYFKIGATTVARLPCFQGHADSQRERITVTTSHSVRSAIRSAARKRGTRSVTLTLVYHLVDTSGASPKQQTTKQYTKFTIPRR